MKKIKFYSVLVLSITMLIALVVGNSCNKPKECKAEITVLDSAGVIPQAGVTVKLYATVTTQTGSTTTADLKAEGVTDTYGKVFFTFKLPAIMDIQAQKNCVTIPPNPGPGTYCAGKGIIKLEEGNTTSKNVYLRQ